jgi:signal recognition particle subunit SRP54
VNKPIKFVGTGEKMEALDVFYPIRMAERTLNGRCCVSLERAQEQFDEEEARRIQKKIAKNEFGFDFTQIQQVKKMGI